VIIPPIGALGGELASAGLTSAADAQKAAAGTASAVSPSGVTGVEAAGVEGAGGSSSSSFGGALTEAVGALEKQQQSASQASQALALGTVADPEAAVVTVEDAQLAMQLASQIRSKATEAAQTIFQTQV
jgi:flagellar hook-basal body complex protein FliE